MYAPSPLLLIQYNPKYWLSLNLAVGPQTNYKKILAEFKFGSGASVLFIKKCCYLSLEVIEQNHKLKIYKKQNRQNASTELAPCTARVRGALDRAKSATGCITSLHVGCETILMDFNLMVSIPAA